MSDPALCIDCERSTGGACPQHPRVVGIEDAFWRAIREGQDEAVARARLEEREACARICDENAQHPDELVQAVARICARLIRERGDK